MVFRGWWDAFMAAVVLLVVVIIYKSTKGSRFRALPLPLGSFGWPFIGETAEFIACAYSDRPERFMDSRRLLYGKVFKSHLFGSPTIVSTDADFNRLILQSDPAFFIPSYPKSLNELMGKSSILLVSGSLQRRLHGLVGSFIKSSSVREQITRDMQEFVRNSMEKWRDDRPVHVQDEARNITFEVLVKVLTSLDPGEEMNYLKKLFEEFISGLISLPVKIPGSQLYRSLQAKKRMVHLVRKNIQSRKRGDNSFVNPPKDVLSLLLNDSHDEFTDELIADNLIDMMIPGEDSVPMLITLAVKYLSDCPAALRQLTEENMKLKNERSNLSETLCWNDFLSLPFTQTVITETLRLGNIIIGVMRKAVKEVEVKGYHIPKGWCVFAYFRSVHLDEDHFENPNEFNPWRWLDQEISSHCFTPFGGGIRLCPGLDLARLEASIFLHHLVTRFRWVAEKDRIVNFPTVRMKRRMPIWLEKICA